MKSRVQGLSKKIEGFGQQGARSLETRPGAQYTGTHEDASLVGIRGVERTGTAKNGEERKRDCDTNAKAGPDLHNEQYN